MLRKGAEEFLFVVVLVVVVVNLPITSTLLWCAKIFHIYAAGGLVIINRGAGMVMMRMISAIISMGRSIVLICLPFLFLPNGRQSRLLTTRTKVEVDRLRV